VRGLAKPLHGFLLFKEQKNGSFYTTVFMPTFYEKL
jgi:hypothetical protein